MNKNISVLFVCIHNSARSQMAEAFLQQLCPSCSVASAGLEPGQLNPLAVAAMQEIGLDISKNSVNTIFDFLRQEKPFDYVITVCDDASGTRCPLFPGKTERLHWSFPDPAAISGSAEEQMEQVRTIRENIRQRVAWFVEERRLA
jgi:arsenate reductase (thioredoxin)